MKGILGENKAKNEFNESKRTSRLRSQTIIQHPLIDTMTRNLHRLSNHQKNRKKNATSFLQQCKQFVLKLFHWMLIYLDNLLHFMLQPVVLLPSKSMISLSSSTSFVLLSSESSKLSLSPMQQQQQQLFVLHSRYMDIRRKRHITTNRNNKKCSYINKTKSTASLAKYNRLSERIIYLPIMKISAVYPNNYSTKQFVIECFNRE